MEEKNSNQNGYQCRTKENINAMADNYRKLLINLGENPDREGLVDTPMRAAKAMMFFTKVGSKLLTVRENLRKFNIAIMY